MTGLKAPTFILGTSLWSYILSILVFLPQIFIGVYIFNAHLVVNIISFVVGILISTLIIFCLAMISTGVRMVTKVTDPVTWGIGIAASLLSGLAFPVQHLDSYVPGLSTVSWVLPQTWIYHIIRLSILQGGSLLDPQVSVPFLVAFAYALVLAPISVAIYRWGLKRAKRDGTLGWL